MPQLPLITPDWGAPENVTAFTTTTAGGISAGDCATLNLGTHVGDNPEHVAENRARLQQYIGTDKQLCWLRQTHSDIVVNVADYRGVVEADAAFSAQPNQVCVVMTADCLPVLLCNSDGNKVAALHCGWKGLHQNLIGKTIRQHFAEDSVIAWLGPSIGKASYEVEDGLYQRFMAQNPDYADAFTANRLGHYLFDLCAIARLQLHNENVSTGNVFGGGFDTLTDERFFSHRRSPNSGRMASLIYIDKP